MSNAFSAVGATVSLSPSAGSVNADFTNGASSALITNTGTERVFVRIQGVANAIAASANDIPLSSGKECILDTSFIASGQLRVSVFCAAAGTALVTPGQGGV